MPKIVLTDTLREAVRIYQSICGELRSVSKELGIEARVKKTNSDVDSRDFYPMLMQMGFKGTTPEARKAEMKQALEEITAAFLDPDTGKRDPYLNRMYDLRDNFRPAEVDLNDPEQALYMVDYLALNQTFAVKSLENPTYMDRRYPDEKGKRLDEAIGGQAIGAAYVVLGQLNKENLTLKPGPTLPYPLPGYEVYYDVLLDHMLDKMQKTREAGDGGDLSGELVLTCPDQLMPFVGLSVQDVLKVDKDSERQLDAYNQFCVETALMGPAQIGTKVLKEAGMKPSEALFVDGVPLERFLTGQGEGDDFHNKWTAMTTLALLSQKHRVEMVYTSLNKDDELQMEAKPIRVQYTPEQEQRHLVENHSWFRRTFFNWGPFRIKSLQEQADALWADPDADRRHEEMYTALKETFDTKRQNKRDKEIKEAARLKTLREEKQRFFEEDKKLEEARNAAKGSKVLSALGDQLKTYDKIHGDMKFDEFPLKNLSSSMARHVLFWQLQQERQQQSDGTVGPMETVLLGKGDEETIRANIDSAADDIAKNPAFQDLLFAKFAFNGSRNEKDLLGENFRRVMSNGGSERFAKDYMLQLKGAQPEKDGPTGDDLNKSMHEMQNKQEGAGLVQGG